MSLIFLIACILFSSLMLYIRYGAPDDPCDKCPVYKYESCSHIDGPCCNIETCIILKNFKQKYNLRTY